MNTKPANSDSDHDVFYKIAANRPRPRRLTAKSLSKRMNKNGFYLVYMGNKGYGVVTGLGGAWINSQRIFPTLQLVEAYYAGLFDGSNQHGDY